MIPKHNKKLEEFINDLVDVLEAEELPISQPRQRPKPGRFLLAPIFYYPQQPYFLEVSQDIDYKIYISRKTENIFDPNAPNANKPIPELGIEGGDEVILIKIKKRPCIILKNVSRPKKGFLVFPLSSIKKPELNLKKIAATLSFNHPLRWVVKTYSDSYTQEKIFSWVQMEQLTFVPQSNLISLLPFKLSDTAFSLMYTFFLESIGINTQLDKKESALSKIGKYLQLISDFRNEFKKEIKLN